MDNRQDNLDSIVGLDSFDSYYECIVSCYGLAGEDIECVEDMN